MAESENPAERRALYARGFAGDTLVGTSGLERVLQLQLEGKPGGTLRAGARTLASSEPVKAKAVRSTIDTRIQAAAVTALAGRLGGIAAIDTRTGHVRALAGIAFSAPQPPGSVFKIVTTAAALEEKKVKLSDEFAVESRALIDGVTLENANGELCGGTFAQSFAKSCNSVFAPLGVKVGSKKLVETAERFGWNQKPRLPGEKASTLPDTGRDRLAARDRLDGDRSVQGAGDAAPDGIRRADRGQRRRAAGADAGAGRAARGASG